MNAMEVLILVGQSKVNIMEQKLYEVPSDVRPPIFHKAEPDLSLRTHTQIDHHIFYYQLLSHLPIEGN